MNEGQTKIPPASPQMYNHLPSIVMTQDDIAFNESGPECIICLEYLEIGTVCCKLDCGHIYHIPCVRDWLQMQCTCPECRYEYQTDDKKFEIDRKQRMRKRNIRCRKDELESKSIKQLRAILDLFGISYGDCFDKIDLVDRLIGSGRVDIQKRAPPIDLTMDDLLCKSVKELKHMLVAFGVPHGHAIEKKELAECLIESGRVQIVVRLTNETHNSHDSVAGNNDTECSSNIFKVVESESTVNFAVAEQEDAAVNLAEISGTDSGSSPGRRRPSIDEATLRELSIKDLLAVARCRNVSTAQCIDKEDVIHRLLTESGY